MVRHPITAFVSYPRLMFRAGWRSSCRSMEAELLAEVAEVVDIRVAAQLAAVDAPAVALPHPVVALLVWAAAQRPGLLAEYREEAEHQLR